MLSLSTGRVAAEQRVSGRFDTAQCLTLDRFGQATDAKLYHVPHVPLQHYLLAAAAAADAATRLCSQTTPTGRLSAQLHDRQDDVIN